MNQATHPRNLIRSVCHPRRFSGAFVRPVLLMLLAFGLAAPGLTGCFQKTSIEECERSVVRIYCELPNGNLIVGTGFIIDNAGMYVVASGYVVSRADENRERIKVETYDGEMLAVERIMWESKPSPVQIAEFGRLEMPSIDLAILKVRPQRLPALRLADRSTVAKGDAVIALGFPEAVREVSIDKYEPFHVRRSDGHISGDQPGPMGYMYQITAPLHLGHNGGPLLNQWGHVVGINVAGLSRDTTVSFAVQSDELIRIAERLRIPVTIVSRRLMDWTNPVLIALIAVALLMASSALFIVLNRDRRAAVVRGAGRFTQAFWRPGGGRSAGGAVLVVVAGDNQGERIPIGRGLRIGRDPGMCNLVVSDNYPKVSKKHAEIRGAHNEGEYYLQDMGARNGTFRGDGTRVPSGSGIVLRTGDAFYLVDKRCMFRVEKG